MYKYCPTGALRYGTVILEVSREGYMGRLLFVDLTGGRIEKIPLPGNLQKIYWW